MLLPIAVWCEQAGPTGAAAAAAGVESGDAGKLAPDYMDHDETLLKGKNLKEEKKKKCIHGGERKREVVVVEEE